ncbi:MAG TPA: LysR family transcriptional regulator [Vicinamibacterales bacterium]|jgi:molybdate transport system regulatory protein|nr:LysR family transcriptional regulator [Vicinamibacterales bacterium]
MKPKIRVWVCFSDRTKFGKGRARLFELIDELGSINKAVQKMGMSYRTAWGYIRELESAAGFQILERTPGRGKEAGARLTREGRRFIERYRVLQRRVEGGVQRAFVHAFKQRSPTLSRRRPRRSP